MLIRIAKNATGDTWRNLRFELEKCHLVRFAGSARDVLQRTEITSRQAAILRALDVPEPPRYAEPPTPAISIPARASASPVSGSASIDARVSSSCGIRGQAGCDLRLGSAVGHDRAGGRPVFDAGYDLLALDSGLLPRSTVDRWSTSARAFRFHNRKRKWVRSLARRIWSPLRCPQSEGT